MSAIVWNTGIPVIEGRIGWGNPSCMDSTEDVGIFDGSGYVCDAILSKKIRRKINIRKYVL